jgi:hypothetical protein
MTKKIMKPLFSILACLMLLVVGASTEALGQTDQTSPSENAGSAPTVAPQTPAELGALVAPIALYPDALVAQVLAASTHVDQVAYADDWLTQNTNLKGKKLADAVNEQSWDPSVKALTQFPTVLHNLAHNLAWTSSLGQAFTNQQADVMAAVQTMRSKAQAVGNLKSSSQITVVQETPSTIVLKPTSPDVVYVPEYNPALIYGAPCVVPSYVPPVVVATPGIYWSSGIGTGGGWGWGGFGWGWGAWNVGWGGAGNVVYNNNVYINRTTYNNYHPWGPGNPGQGPYGPHPNPGFGPGGYHPTGGGGTPVSPYGPGGTNGGGYHPTGGGLNPIRPSGPGGTNPPGSGGGYHPMSGGGFTPSNGSSHAGNYSPYGAFSPSHSYNPTFANAQHGSYGSGFGNGFGRSNFGASQQRSFMNGNGFHDRAASSRGWGSMRSSGMSRPMHMSAPRMGGGFRR